MSKARGKLIILLVLLALILGVFVIKLAGGLNGSRMKADTVGTPLVWNQENATINSSITQVLETKDTLFLVYGYKSIVQSYSLEGTYLYTISVYDFNNGRTEIAYNKNKDILYISDKRHNIYAFSGEEFLAYIDDSDAWDLYTKMYFGRSTWNYSVKAGSVWYTDGENSRCVVERPVWQTLYQSNTLDLILLFLLILTGFVLYFPYPPKK